MVQWIRTEGTDFIKVSAFDFVGLDDCEEDENQSVSLYRLNEEGEAVQIRELFAVNNSDTAYEMQYKFMELLTDPEHGPILDVCMEVL